MNPVLLSSKVHTYQTPPEVLDLVRAVAPIGLDPATAPDNPTGARCYLTEAHDGLKTDWRTSLGEIVFLNPPYGRAIGTWTDRVVRQGVPTISLTPARPDAQWWIRAARDADDGVFWEGRIHFIDPATCRPVETLCKKTGKMKSSKAAFPVNLMIHNASGRLIDRFREVFGPKGTLFSVLGSR